MIGKIASYVSWGVVMLAPVFGLLTYRQWPSIGYTAPLVVSAVLGLPALVFITVRDVSAEPWRVGLYVARCGAIVALGPLEQFLIALHSPFELQVFIVAPLFIGFATWFITELVPTG